MAKESPYREECSNCRWSEEGWDEETVWCEFNEGYVRSDHKACKEYRGPETRNPLMKGDKK